MEKTMPIKMTSENWEKHKNATDCHICNKSLIKDWFMDSVQVHDAYMLFAGWEVRIGKNCD